MQRLLPEAGEQAALCQHLPPACHQAGPAQSKDRRLPDRTPAHQEGASRFQSLHLQLRTGHQAQRGPGREPHWQAGHRTADPIYWAKNSCRRVEERGGWDTSLWGCRKRNTRLGMWRDEGMDADLLWD